jgi:hypothetical protein
MLVIISIWFICQRVNFNLNCFCYISNERWGGRVDFFILVITSWKNDNITIGTRIDPWAVVWSHERDARVDAEIGPDDARHDARIPLLVAPPLNRLSGKPIGFEKSNNYDADQQFVKMCLGRQGILRVTSFQTQ